MHKLTLAEITKDRYSLSELEKSVKLPVYLVLDNIRSLWNVGSCFRTADACRIEKLILCGITGTPPRPEIEKTALGSVDSISWQYYSKTQDAIKTLKEEGITTIAFEHTTISKDFTTFDYQVPCAIILGNEVEGIKDDVLKEVDYHLEIPMFGTKHSLNVSVTCGVVLYDIMKKLFDKGFSFST